MSNERIHRHIDEMTLMGHTMTSNATNATSSRTTFRYMVTSQFSQFIALHGMMVRGSNLSLELGPTAIDGERQCMVDRTNEAYRQYEHLRGVVEENIEALMILHPTDDTIESMSSSMSEARNEMSVVREKFQRTA